MSVQNLKYIPAVSVLYIVCNLEASLQISSTFQTQPSSHQSEYLFTKLDAAETGLSVENPYDDKQMWTSRYREFMGGGMGSGIAAGDFDQDGLVDLYVSTKTSPGRLFRNLGNWKFEDVTEEAGLSEKTSVLGWLSNAISEDEFIWRQGAVFADVDNDGRLDLYVCRNEASNLLYMNQGNGTFSEEGEKRGLDLADGSVAGAFADYDRDGWLDVFVLTNQVEGNEPSGRADRLYRNTGNGNFEEVTQIAGIRGETFGHSATWIDFDHDLWPDLYVANDFSGSDHFYHNNQDGTFTNVLDSIVPHTPYSSMGADLGDINNDGHFDLLVTDMATVHREKDKRGLAASRNDILTTGTTDGVAPQYTRNALLLNTGLGSFGEAACWAGLDATDWTWSVRFEDFDNDGWEDLHVTNGMVREANNSDLLNNMMRALSDMQRIAVIKRAPPLEEANLAYRNLKGEGFQNVSKKWGLDEIGIAFGAATADFDLDGDIDIAYLNYNGGVSLFRNDISQQNRVQVRLRGTRSNHFGVGAVVRVESPLGRQTRSMTVSRGYASGSELVAHFGLGSDDSIAKLTVEWPSGSRQEFSSLKANRAYLVSEDPNSAPPPSDPTTPLFADQSKTLGLAVEDKSGLAIPDGEQAFLPFRTDRAGPSIVAGHLDSDKALELLLTATTASPNLKLSPQNGHYSQSSIEGLPKSNSVENGPALLFDANGDGAKDLLLTKASADYVNWPKSFEPTLYLGDGADGFEESSWLPSLPINAGAAAAADIDGDGDLDLFIGARSIPGRYPETPQSALLRNDGDRFTLLENPNSTLASAGLVKSALFRDIDRDGRSDLLLALEWDLIRCFLNQGDGRFIDQTEQLGFDSGGRGWWNSLAAADFNGDGRLDFAAGNLGLNTTYEASPKQPATLFYGDFAQNGTKLLAEAVYDESELYPIRSRGDLITRLPFILRKYPKNNDFAKATMSEVFTQAAIDRAKKLEADNFSSGVFLSQPDDTYRFASFPRIAQIAPMLGMVAIDLDGDSLPDLCATQNTDVAIPRFHGGVGVFLKGLGDGNFKALAPEVSGVMIRGNGRALIADDLDGNNSPDLFLTRHNGVSALLENRSSAEDWIILELSGKSGNPNAIGAGIELRFSDGSTTYHELGLGGAWLSQSSPRIYIAQSDDKGLESASIRWPDGQNSHHDFPPRHGPWTISKPAKP